MKTSLKHLLVLTTLIIGAVGCSEEPAPVPEEDPQHEYMGIWSGTFEGGDSGEWDMTVDENGDFTGEVYSNGGQNYHPLSGSIDDKGVLTATIDISGVILDFSGQGSGGTTASGTWGNPSINITGTWSGTKQ